MLGIDTTSEGNIPGQHGVWTSIAAFLQIGCLNSFCYENCIEICSRGYRWYVIIGSDNGLSLNKRQAIIWTNDDPVQQSIYVALGARSGEKIFLFLLQYFMHICRLQCMCYKSSWLITVAGLLWHIRLNPCLPTVHNAPPHWKYLTAQCWVLTPPERATLSELAWLPFLQIGCLNSFCYENCFEICSQGYS